MRSRTLEGNFFLKVRTQLAEVSENERKMQRVYPSVSCYQPVPPGQKPFAIEGPRIKLALMGLKPRAPKVPQMGLDGPMSERKATQAFPVLRFSPMNTFRIRL